MDQALLKEYLEYSPITGTFTWIKKAGRKTIVGAAAGYRAKNGYTQIRLQGQLYYAHRLAFLYQTGNFPHAQIDHINGDTDDNRWVNLRPVSGQQNQQNAAMSRNNTSGVHGVTWDKRKQKWLAKIMVARKSIFLGYFTELLDAQAARKQADHHYNFHVNHGRAR